METVSQSTALLALAALGALVQFVLALRLYEPPPPEDGEPPTPLIEAALFFVVFALFYGVVGVVLSALEDVTQPYGSLGVLVAGIVGLSSAYALYAGKIGGGENPATRAMGLAIGVTSAALAAVVLVL